jgi:N-acetylglucosaminyldiphosphoundecaprenol N-acetyl-beta-D-mannosaminyltransferase
MNNERTKVEVLGITIDNLTMGEVLSSIDDFIAQGKPASIHTVNASHVRLHKADEEFAEAYAGADLVTADGMPILWAASLLGNPLREKVSGSDLTRVICEESAKRGYKIYLFGASPGVAEKAKQRCEQRYPGIRIEGVYSPDRKELEDEKSNRALIGQINSSGANILFVGLGAPFREIWILRSKPLLNVPVIIGCGGAIDYLAGTIRRPAPWVIQLGLEWFVRLVQDPRRYWKRYVNDASILYYMLLEILRLLKDH